MEKILISIPDELISRMRATIPARQRSKTIASLIETEVKKREQLFYACAVAVENDTLLRDEMEEWDITLENGLNDGSW
jgi:hypothetical protein